MSARAVIYTGSFCLFPADAAGRRVLALASALHISGIAVLLCPALGRMPEHILEFDPAEDYDRQIQNGVQFSLRALLSGIRALDRSHAVILYNPSNFLALVVRAMAQIHGLHAVLDLTEWYEYSHLPSWRAKAEVFVRMNITYRLFSRMIFISDFLAAFFRPRIGVTIPPLIEEEEVQANSRPPVERGGLRILYAGFPGRKDRIDLLIEWLARAKLPFPVELVLAGPRAEQLPTAIDQNQNGLRIVALGPVDRQRVFQLYRECHLSAIVRDDARYEWAGFPTKAVEGWNLGVPVMVMSHSRFARKAREYGAALVIDAADPVASLERALREIAQDKDRMEDMSKAARSLAGDQHRISSYVADMKRVVGADSTAESRA